MRFICRLFMNAKPFSRTATLCHSQRKPRILFYISKSFSSISARQQNTNSDYQLVFGLDQYESRFRGCDSHITFTLWGGLSPSPKSELRSSSLRYRDLSKVLVTALKQDKPLQEIGRQIVNDSLALHPTTTAASFQFAPSKTWLSSASSDVRGEFVSFQAVRSTEKHTEHTRVPKFLTKKLIYKYHTIWFTSFRGREHVVRIKSQEAAPKDAIDIDPMNPDVIREALNLAPILQVHRYLARCVRNSTDELIEELVFNLKREAFVRADDSPGCSRLEWISISIGIANSPSPLFASKLSREEYEQTRVLPMRMLEPPTLEPRILKFQAYIALGSNIGDRVEIIEKACQEMQRRGIKILRTSALYETKPMYVEEQDSFINGVCEVATTLEPLNLLDALQGIEKELGRQKTIEKGPRNIDLDILLYKDEPYQDNDERLSIPHKLMLERDFVLRPLCDLTPHGRLPSPMPSKKFQNYLEDLPKSSTPLSPLTPLSSSLPSITSITPTRSTHVMAILNLTPDSFSDGGLHTSPSNPLFKTIQSFLTAGATILDIGGQSTRPHAPQVSPSVELSRILPAIQAIRSNTSFNNLAISVDTYRASIARVAIAAGANIVNDVSAGVIDREMLSTVAKLGCTIILMHMRGTPETMNSLTDYPNGLIPTIAAELLARVRAAEAAGIFRWRIILDPGIGFAKTGEQNLEILRRFDELRNWEDLRGLPWCVGTSRKAFIGNITGVKEAKDRVWGTAGAVTAAVRGGADIVRVHDVKEMVGVVKMADAIWRVDDRQGA